MALCGGLQMSDDSHSNTGIGKTTTESHILGMTMSMVMLSVVGAIPISRALSAIVVEYHTVDRLLMGSGVLTAITIVSFYFSSQRNAVPQAQ